MAIASSLYTKSAILNNGSQCPIDRFRILPPEREFWDTNELRTQSVYMGGRRNRVSFSILWKYIDLISTDPPFEGTICPVEIIEPGFKAKYKILIKAVDLEFGNPEDILRFDGIVLEQMLEHKLYTRFQMIMSIFPHMNERIVYGFEQNLIENPKGWYAYYDYLQENGAEEFAKEIKLEYEK